MKKILSAVVVTLVAMSFTTAVFAADTTSPANPSVVTSPAGVAKNDAKTAEVEAEAAKARATAEAKAEKARLKAEAKEAKAKVKADKIAAKAKAKADAKAAKEAVDPAAK